LASYMTTCPPKIKFWVTDTYLLEQAADDAAKFSVNFIIYIYRSDREKDSVLPSGVKVLTSPLTFRHEIFNNNNVVKANTIVIVSKGTLAARHRPGAAANHARDHLGLNRVTTKSAMSMSSRPPTDWERSLESHVDVVIIDEAYNIGKRNIDVWVAIRWLAADFYILLTATPVP